MNYSSMKFLNTFLMIILLSLCSVMLVQADQDSENHEVRNFFDSFIRHYEFNPEGRYTHEYHPFLLDKTAHSLGQLEQRFKDEGLALKGRVVIVGYEESAVPSYYTDYRQSRINDEASLRNNAGWSLRLHNRFGFMTGFLFKDFNKIAACVFKNQDHVFEHIDAEQIRIFDDRANVFHEHAFGEAYPLVQRAQASVVKKFQERKFLDIFSDLVKFWQIMYGNMLKVGNKQVGATQDILFSIAYAQHLLKSNLPFFSYFTGPDITYPIEITSKHDKFVSRHAQSFVGRLFDRLKPVDDQPTAYVFCSFVDGVGKSTTLGNIKNAMKHGDNVEEFEHVDNSSSQLAEVFQCKDNVFIADLPAQMSHFTFKPDGLVYVDARTEFDDVTVDAIIDHFRKNRAEYSKDYQSLQRLAAGIMREEGFCDPSFHDENDPELAFVKNLLLLKKQHKKWIPFSYNSQHYIIRDSTPTELRVLIPLSNVKSEGLKNIESEQMLFFQGIRLPLPYEHFLDDLVNQLKQQNIQNVVFVDFMSMYPRSSRENVRINYLLQQMAYLFNDFSPGKSLYKDFVSCGELLHNLLEPKTAQTILQGFEHEVLVRLALYQLIIQRQSGGIEGLTLPVLTDLIRHKIEQVGVAGFSELRMLTASKFQNETKRLQEIFGLTKDFVNVQCFSFERVAEFSRILQEFFTTNISHDQINALWQDNGQMLDVVNPNLQEGPLDIVMKTVDGSKMRVLHKFGPECRSETVLAQFFKDLRVFWYAALSNLLDGQKQMGSQFSIPTAVVPVPPMFVKQGTDGSFYAAQAHMKGWVGDVGTLPKVPYDLFNLPPTQRLRYGEFDDNVYRLDWRADVTNRGLFGFGCDLSKVKKRGFYVPAVFMIVQRYQNKFGTHTVMPTSKLLKELKKSNYWKSVYQGWKTEAEKNSRVLDLRKTADGKALGWAERFIAAMPQKSTQPIKRAINFATQHQRQAARMVIRLLATLEMVVKDPDADVVVRLGHRKDFKAALKLYERVVMPYFFGILFKEPLFDDYGNVEPYPDWDSLESFIG